MQSQSDVRVGEISNFRNMLGLDSVMSSTVGAQSHGHGQIGPEFKTKFLGFRCYAQGDKACFLICQSHKNKGYLLGWNVVKLKNTSRTHSSHAIYPQMIPEYLIFNSD